MIFRAGAWVAVGALTGRLAGFAREIVLANELGAEAAADQAVLLITIPDLLTGVLAGGALSAALMPALTRLNESQAAALFFQSAALVLAVGSLLTLALAQAPELVLLIFAPGMHGAVASETAGLLRVVLWVVPLSMLAGVTTAYLRVNRYFFITAFGTLIVNTFAILGLYLSTHGATLQLETLAWCLCLGALLRFASQWFNARVIYKNCEIVYRRLIDRELCVRYGQALLAGSLILLLPIAGRSLSSLEGSGALAIFNYSLRLVDFPLGIGLPVIVSVLIPFLARAVANNKPADADLLVEFGAVITILMATLMGLPLIVYSELVAELVYGWGDQLDPASLAQIQWLTCLGLAALPARAISLVLIGVYSSLLDTRTPMYVSLIALGIYLPTGGICVSMWGLSGLMAALTAVFYLIAALQLGLLWKMHGHSVLHKLTRKDNVLGLAAAATGFLPFGLVAGSDAGALLKLLALLAGVLAMLSAWLVFNRRWLLSCVRQLRSVTDR